MVRSDYDYTMMSTYMTCHRKYHYRMERGLVGKVSQTAPDFGKAIHKGLDSWYHDHDLEKATAVFKTHFVEQLDVDDKRTHQVGAWILKNYDEKYRDQPFKVLQTEQEFCLPLGNGNNLIGRIDKIIEWDGVTWVVDHKTTSQLGPQYFRMHTPNLQFDGYTWAAHRLGYTNCQGVLVDAILVAKGLLETAARGKLTPLARDFAYRTNEDIDDFVAHAWSIQQSIWNDELRGLWVPNYDACTYYGECPYRRICKEPKDLRERIIGMDYRVSHWDPRGKEKE